MLNVGWFCEVFIKSLDFSCFLLFQVKIEIKDVNDNFPEFESDVVRIYVLENADVGVPLYSAHAKDKDSDSNGMIRYKIAINAQGLFKIDPRTGDLTLTRHLDFETAQRHSLIITATDQGIPPLSANLTMFVEVQDINDNPPVFERNEYSLSVLESLPVNSQVSVKAILQIDILRIPTHFIYLKAFTFLNLRLLNVYVKRSCDKINYITIRQPVEKNAR